MYLTWTLKRTGGGKRACTRWHISRCWPVHVPPGGGGSCCARLGTLEHCYPAASGSRARPAASRHGSKPPMAGFSEISSPAPSPLPSSPSPGPGLAPWGRRGERRRMFWESPLQPYLPLFLLFLLHSLTHSLTHSFMDRTEKSWGLPLFQKNLVWTPIREREGEGEGDSVK